MTREEKLNFITQQIRDALPHLKELSVGCEIIVGRTKYNRGVIVRANKDEDGEVSSVNILRMGKYTYENHYSERKDIKEIIGHSPTLVDLLVFLQKREDKQNKNHWLDMICTLSGCGVLSIEVVSDLSERVKERFELDTQHTYLKDQPDSVIDVLYDYLTINE